MLANCCAIGRRSVDATNACRSRAVFAALAALLAVLLLLAGAWLLAACFFLVVFALSDFDFGLRAERWPESLTESSCVCAATGETAISTQSKPARQWVAVLAIETGEEAAFILFTLFCLNPL
jgi:hypothetical protein